MKIYHGTAEKFLPDILKNGIEAREERESNWEQYHSRSDMVYLSVAYPIYFAMSVSSKEGEDMGRPVVLEIDLDKLDEDRLFPDEDFVSWAISHNEKITLDEVHNDVRDNLENYQEYWELSLENLGNCCYKGTVPASAISRYAIFDPEKQSILTMMSLDPVISVMNYRIIGQEYEQLVAWLFGDEKEIPLGHAMLNLTEDKPLTPWEQKQKEKQKEASENREGIEIVSVTAKTQ